MLRIECFLGFVSISFSHFLSSLWLRRLPPASIQPLPAASGGFRRLPAASGGFRRVGQSAHQQKLIVRATCSPERRKGKERFGKET